MNNLTHINGPLIECTTSGRSEQKEYVNTQDIFKQLVCIRLTCTSHINGLIRGRLSKKAVNKTHVLFLYC